MAGLLNAEVGSRSKLSPWREARGQGGACGGWGGELTSSLFLPVASTLLVAVAAAAACAAACAATAAACSACSCALAAE